MSLRQAIILLVLFSMLLGPAAASARSAQEMALTPTHTIREARQAPNGTSVIVQGTISAPLNVFRFNEMWVQDDTAGIDIWDYTPTGLQLGDTVEISGTVAEYNGKKEIANGPNGYVLLVDRGVPPTPLVTQTGAISETSEGWLVVVTGTVSNKWGSGFDLDDGSGPTAVYIDSDTGIDLSGIQNGDLITLVGLSSQYDSSPPYDSGYQVLPRFQYDIAEGVVQPIALARQVSAGMTVTVAGAVTCLPGTFEAPDLNRELYIQDGTGGVDVFQYNGLPIPSNTLSLGDIIIVTGTVDFYNGKLEIVPSEVVTTGLTGTVVPKIQFAGKIGETTEGLLVVLTGTVSNKWGGGGNHGGFDLTDASGTVAVFVDRDTGIDMSFFDNGDVLRVIGLSAQYDSSPPYDSGYQVQPRVQSDLALAAGDFDPPGITATVPVSGAVDVNPHLPVQAVFDEEMDATTIDETTFWLEGPAGPVNATVYYDNDRMTAVLLPAAPLETSTLYTATVAGTVQDKAGNPMGSDFPWTFTTAAQVTFAPYLGSIHNHTSYSDGVLDPATAYATAHARGLDFFGLTDHSHAVDDAEWLDTLAQAVSATVDGEFVALAGFEYTNSSEGHVNIFNTIRRAIRTDQGYAYGDYCATMEDFYNWVELHPEAVGHFNHPAWMNFNDWTYRPSIEPQMQMVEVGNGAYSYYVWTEEEYIKGLDYGWRFGPTNNGDTHSDQWGLDNPGRSGVWATELTYQGIIEAMRAMRVFTTEDGNWVLYLKADGAWMGQTIPNDGQIEFTAYLDDPDGEAFTSLALVSDQGQVVTSTVPTSNPYTWTVSLDISEGVHYYYLRAVEADGDRGLSAPIWTEGDVDVAPTKLTVVPARLTTYAPANFEVRLTNRGISDVLSLTVNFYVNTTTVGSAVVDVPVGMDAFAGVDWMPDVTGTITIWAELVNPPAGDNPADNTIAVERDVVDYPVPLIVIDNGHNNNVFVSGSAGEFKQDLVDYGFNWIEDTDGFASGDLDNADLLIISDPGAYGEDVYTEVEEQVITDFVNNGGALLVAGDSDYHDHGNPDELNNLLARIDGARIRLNRDGTYDDTNNGGVGPWHVLWHNLPAWQETGIGTNVNTVVGFSGCSIYGVDEFGTPIPLTTGNGITVTVYGDDDTYQNDDGGDGFYFTYTDPFTIPMAAVQLLPNGGRIAVWGDSNESFSDAYTYVPGDTYQNEIYNMETIYWLMGTPLQRSTIATVRYDAEWNDTPDQLDRLVWVEGTLTAGQDNFYEALYMQEDSGGIAIRMPSLEPPTDTYPLGAVVRAVGRIEITYGETEIRIVWDPEQVQVISPGVVPDPLVLSTTDAVHEENEGWLMQTEGLVTGWYDAESFIVNDGSGPARILLEGNNQEEGNDTFESIQIGYRVRAIGIGSENAGGPNLRVRTESDITIITRTCTPLLDLQIAGPDRGMVSETVVLSAVLSPTDATTPLFYTWSPEPPAGQGSAVVTYTWSVTGSYGISLEVLHCGGTFSATHTVEIGPAAYRIYLPLLLKAYGF